MVHPNGQRRHHQRLPGSYWMVIATRRRRRRCRGPCMGRRDDYAGQALHRGGVGWAEPRRVCDGRPGACRGWDVCLFLEAHALPYANASCRTVIGFQVRPKTLQYV